MTDLLLGTDNKFTESIPLFMKSIFKMYVSICNLEITGGRSELSVLGCLKNQSGAWYAEAVDRAVIRKLEKIKTLLGFKKFSGWRSRRNLSWVMSCKRSVKANS